MDTERELKEIIDIISKLRWTFAKTMKNIPHWYTVKNKKSKEESEMYEKLFMFIFDNHYIRYFRGKPYKYVDIGEWSYWIMTDDISESIIINRARKE